MFFVTEVSIPGVSGQPATLPTPFVDVPITSDKLTFDQLQVTYKIDENFQSYLEIFNWIQGLGFPQDGSQYAALQNAARGSELTLYSDATLTILTSKLHSNIEFTFEDCLPMNISPINMTWKESTTNYAEVTVTFAFKKFTVRRLSA